MIKKLNENELKQIIGGSDVITGTLINAFSKGIEALLEVGRSLGTAIRRLITNQNCLK